MVLQSPYNHLGIMAFLVPNFAGHTTVKDHGNFGRIGNFKIRLISL